MCTKSEHQLAVAYSEKTVQACAVDCVLFSISALMKALSVSTQTRTEGKKTKKTKQYRYVAGVMDLVIA